MGNQANKQSVPLKTPSQSEFEIICQSEQGFVARSLSYPIKYFIRQISFSTYQQLHKILPSIHHLTQNSHASITSLLHSQQTNISNMCGSVHKLRLIFQYSMLSINDEVEARRAEMRYFQYGDACRIIYGCIKALSRMESDYQQHAELVKFGIINRVFINPERILVMDDGVIKLASNMIVSPYDRYQHKHNCYYSPQKLYDFDFQQDVKSSLFQLGITLLHILTLTPCKQLYNGFEVKQDEIDVRIFRIWELYHDTLICEILSKITRTSRNFRIGLRQCEDMAQFLSFRLEQKQQMEKSKMKKQIQYYSQNAQMRQQINNDQRYYTQLGEVCQRINSQASDSIISQEYENQASNKQNLVSYSSRKNQMSSLRYSSYSESQRKATDIMKIEAVNLDPNCVIKCMSTKKSIQLPQFVSQQQNNRSKISNTSAQKDSYLVTNQSPFYNIAMIASNSSVSPTHQQPRLNKGKQSYYYGNQLAEGLIQKNLNLSSPIRLLNQFQLQNNHVLKKKQEKPRFQWKRTQFNKKHNKQNQKNQENIEKRVSAMQSVNQMLKENQINDIYQIRYFKADKNWKQSESIHIQQNQASK